ncbi:uncharacterized protein LOC143628098 [Bidens hawaiensis]|uniref:uncharacterized protein LOC143628098 n=1 Tax=Bidens hawaiensis TaxID=980011 RepID=UPI00404B5B6A
MPFSLVFGAEAVIPTEMVYPTARTSIRDPKTNNENLVQDLDTMEELRDQARFRMATYQQKTDGEYNKNIRIRRFHVGDLVLRKAFQNTTYPADGKLAPKWEGPYLIESEAGKGAYHLMNSEGDMLPRAWNVIHLKKFLFCQVCQVAEMPSNRALEWKIQVNILMGKVLRIENPLSL